MAQHARPVGPTTNAAATFEPSMVQGSRPDRSPEREAWRQTQRRPGWHTAQTTHVAATFQPNMVSDTRPQQKREFLPLRTGWRHWPPDIAVFSPEMAQGSRPSLPRIFLAPRLPLPVSQPTHVQAPFSIEMADGWTPGPRPIERGRAGCVGIAPDVPDFSVEMTQGWHSDRPTIFSAPRLPLPWAQTTAVAPAVSTEMVQGQAPRLVSFLLSLSSGCQTVAPDVVDLMVEMVQGARPERPRVFLAPRLSLSVSQTTPVSAPFGSEMVSGEKPARPPKQDLRLRTGWLGHTTDVFAFSVEMTQGFHPDAPCLFLAPRLPLPWGQTSHVAAGLSPEMTQGVRFIQSQYKALNDGLTIPPPDIQILVVEQVQGWHPDSPRIRLAPRIPLPASQTTHTSAAFSPEMILGWKPERFRELRPKFGWVIYQVVQAVGPAAGPDVILLVGADASVILITADANVLLVEP